MGDASGLCAMMEPSGSGDEGPAAAAAAVVNNPMQVLDLEGECECAVHKCILFYFYY